MHISYIYIYTYVRARERKRESAYGGRKEELKVRATEEVIIKKQN